MKRKGILLAAVIMLSAATLTQAQEGQLSGTFDVTWLNRYIWRGFDIYRDDHSAIQSSIDLDLYGTGFGAGVFWSRASSGGFEDVEELDLTLYYGNSVFEGETYATDYRIGWGYYNFPDNPYRARDMQEFFATLSWPEICPAGVVPSYTVICMWPSRSNSTFASDADGSLHIFGLGYDMTVSGLLPEIPEQTLHLSAELVYNDGVTPSPAAGANVDHDWSHAVVGVSTDFELYDNLALTPGAYWQVSMDDSVNNDDEVWISLSVSYKF